MTPSEFRAQLDSLFGEDDLRELCFELDIDYENLPGSTKSGKARELFIYSTRRGLLESLRSACERLRPNASWPPIAGVAGAAPVPAAPTAPPPPGAAPARSPDALMQEVRQALGALREEGAASATPVPDALAWHFPLLVRALVEGRLVLFLGGDVNLCGRPAGQAWEPGSSPRLLGPGGAACPDLPCSWPGPPAAHPRLAVCLGHGGGGDAAQRTAPPPHL